MNNSPRSRWIRIVTLIIIFAGAGYLYISGAFNKDSINRLCTNLPVGMLQVLHLCQKEPEPLYVGVIIPQEVKDFSTEMERTIEIFKQDHPNVNGRRLVIIPYRDGQDSPKEAQPVADQIIREKRVLVVIGHIYSNSSIAVGEKYANAGIPIITASAGSPEVTHNNPWFFRSLSSNSLTAPYAAIYAAKVLDQSQASVIYEDNQFGESLDQAFKDTFIKNGTISYEAKMSHRNNLDESGRQEAQAIIEKMTQPGSPSPGIVFLALNDNEAIQFMVAMDEAGQKYPLLAAYDQGDANFAKKFKRDDPGFAKFFADYLKKHEQPVQLTDGLIAFSPIVYDVANNRARDFYNTYINDYKEEPTWLGATTYDALLVAWDALDKTKATGASKTIGIERKKIRDYLASIKGFDKALEEGLTGPIYFDADRNFSQPPTFGIFRNGNFVSAPIQLRPVPDKRLISDLDAALKSGDVIEHYGQIISKANVVYTGIHINEITDVDVDKSHTFTADFYLWFTYDCTLENNVSSVEFINSVNPIQLGNPIQEIPEFNSLNPVQPCQTIQGAPPRAHYRLYRVRDKFYSTSNLEDYPFDKQTLAIQFRHSTLTSEKLIYVEDVVGMNGDNRDGFSLNTSLNTDWLADKLNIFIDTQANKDSFGNPALLGVQQNMENSTFNAETEIKRNSVRFVLKNMLPLFFVLMLAYLSLYLPGYRFDSFISVITGSLLSVVFFHVNLSNRLNVGYNVALDYVFFSTYLLLVFVLLICILAWHSLEKENEKEKEKEKILENEKEKESIIEKGNENEKYKHTKQLMTLVRVAYPLYLIGMGALMLWLYTNPNGLIYLGWLKDHLKGF